MVFTATVEFGAAFFKLFPPLAGLWNLVFLFSNLSLVFLMPFAYFFTESEGFVGSKKVPVLIFTCKWHLNNLCWKSSITGTCFACLGGNGTSV